MPEIEYTLSLSSSRRASVLTRNTYTWSQFTALLATPRRTAETMAEYAAMSKEQRAAVKDVGAFVAGTFRGNKRKKELLEARCMVTQWVVQKLLWVNLFAPLLLSGSENEVFHQGDGLCIRLRDEETTLIDCFPCFGLLLSLLQRAVEEAYFTSHYVTVVNVFCFNGFHFLITC